MISLCAFQISANDMGFSEQTFRSNATFRTWFVSEVVGQPNPSPSRVLDIGCGDGSILCDLAEAWPGAECRGIDLSASNIRTAASDAERRGLSSRVTFMVGEYLSAPSWPADLVVSNSVIHLIIGDSGRLQERLRSDAAAGARLILCMPWPCIYNRCLWLIRRLTWLLPRHWSMGMGMWLARWLHGQGMDDAGLRERLSYWWLMPQRCDDHTWRSGMERCGFALGHVRTAPHAGFGQPKHRLISRNLHA